MAARSTLTVAARRPRWSVVAAPCLLMAAHVTRAPSPSPSPSSTRARAPRARDSQVRARAGDGCRDRDPREWVSSYPATRARARQHRPSSRRRRCQCRMASAGARCALEVAVPSAPEALLASGERAQAPGAPVAARRPRSVPRSLAGEPAGPPPLDPWRRRGRHGRDRLAPRP